MLKELKVFIFILIAFSGLTQKPMVQLIVEPKTAQVGEEITVTVKTNIGNNIDIDLPAAYLAGNTVMRGSNIEMDYNTGKLISFFYLSQTGTMTKEGTFTMGPAFVKKGSKVFKSNTISIKIEKDKPAHFGNDVSAKQMRQPAFGIIEKSKNKIYEGEPLVISAKIYARFTPSYLDGYQPYKLDGVLDEHELGNNQNISVGESTVKGVRMYSFDYDKKLIFPSKIGKQTISPFKLNLKTDFDGYSFTSNSSSIEVVPLPKGTPKDFTGGVGQFDFKSEIKGNSYNQGDVFELILTVKGNGNLHNIDKPKLNLPSGMVEYGDPLIEEDYIFGYKGAEGTIKYTYHIQLIKSGKISLPEQRFTYFDPSKEEYITIKQSKFEFNIKGNPNISNTTTIPSSQNINEQIVSQNKKLKSKEVDSSLFSKQFLVGVIGIPLSLGLIFLLVRKNKRKESIPKEEILSKSEKSASESLNSFIKEQIVILNSHKDGNEVYSLIPKIFQKTFGLYIYNDCNIYVGKAEIFKTLAELNISSELIAKIEDNINLCEQYRFGVINNEVSVEELKSTTIVLLNKIEKELK